MNIDGHQIGHHQMSSEIDRFEFRAVVELSAVLQVTSRSNVIREYLFIIESKENFSEKDIYRMWTRLTTTPPSGQPDQPS